MKKFYSILCGLALACGMTANAYDLVTFEDFDLCADGHAFIPQEYDMVYSGDFYFSCYSNNGYWNGVTVSRTTSNTFAGLDDQYNAITGGGCDGSKAFAIAYYSEYDANNSEQYPEINEFTECAPFYPEYVYVTNTAYAVNSMENGDAYAKKFDENDYLKVIFKGMNIDWDKEPVELVETGTQVEFYLAKDGKIVKDWQKVDLSALGEVDLIRMVMDSSDKGTWGINTPTYFAFDNFKASKTPVEPVTGISDVKVSSTKAYKTIENGQVIIVNGNTRYDMTGRVIK